MSYWVAVYKFTWLLIVAGCVIGLLCVFLPKYAEFKHLQEKQLQYEEELRLKEAELMEYRRNQELFSTNREFVEETARKSGMIKTNETLVKMVDDDPIQTNSAAPIPSPSQ
ncbi:MAG: hypothetical protein E4H02_01260 [Lentisphaerales bacterium]|jgi:cell division protein FtsB|nr:MAG: hypothetical protein E4H02_01260 [Lentisphaerales bacterium]